MTDPSKPTPVGKWFAYAPGTEPISGTSAEAQMAPLPPSGQVTLSPEYGFDLPLSGTEPDKLNLSAELLTDLRNWQIDFDINFDPFEGWLSEEARERWANEVPALVQRLRDEVPVGLRVEVNLWPLEEDDDDEPLADP